MILGKPTSFKIVLQNNHRAPYNKLNLYPGKDHKKFSKNKSCFKERIDKIEKRVKNLY